MSDDERKDDLPDDASEEPAREEDTVPQDDVTPGADAAPLEDDSLKPADERSESTGPEGEQPSEPVDEAPAEPEQPEDDEWYDDEGYGADDEPEPEPEAEQEPEDEDDEWEAEGWEDEDWADDEPEEAGSSEIDAAATTATQTAVATTRTDSIDEDDEDEEGGARMSLVEHLEELRKRIFLALLGLFIGMGATVAFGKQILAVLINPYNIAMARQGLDYRLKTGAHFGGISMYFTVCLISGLIVSSPWVFYQIWRFVAEGLYKRERRYVMRAIPFSVLLFIFGALFFLFGVSTVILGFLLKFDSWLGLERITTLKEHLAFMTRMMIVFGLGFQMPLVVLVLTKVGLVSRKTIAGFRRYVIVCIFIFAAVFTSPSPVDQLLLAIPMWVLFELGLILSYFAEKKREREEQEFLDS